MFGLGFWEIALILGVALIIFGPAKLPELARSLGRGLREFRNATDDFKNTIDAELHDRDRAPSVSKPSPAETISDTVARDTSFPVEEAEIVPDGEPVRAEASKGGSSGSSTDDSQARAIADAGQALNDADNKS